MDDPVLSALERDEAYRVVRALAEKPSGKTELVSSTDGALCVRKRIPLELANEEAWGRLSSITDPHLPRIIEMYRLPDEFVVVSAYVEGDSVADIVGYYGTLAPEQVLPIIEGVCTAAGILHAYGIIHRDITPANVIVRGRDVHLIDLGIARVGDANARHDTTRLGTWGFAAPEQYGFAQTDARSDVYSIGCLAAYMLTGIRPDGEGFEEAIAGLSESMRAVIDRARAFEPSARYMSASELSVAFSEAVSHDQSFLKRLASSLFPTPGVRFVEAFRAADSPRKALALLLPLPILAMAQPAFSRAAERWGTLDVRQKVSTLLFALVYLAFWAGSAFHCSCAVVRSGGYATEKHPVKRYFSNVLLMFFAMISLLVAVSMVFGQY